MPLTWRGHDNGRSVVIEFVERSHIPDVLEVKRVFYVVEVLDALVHLVNKGAVRGDASLCHAR